MIRPLRFRAILTRHPLVHQAPASSLPGLYTGRGPTSRKPGQAAFPAESAAQREESAGTKAKCVVFHVRPIFALLLSGFARVYFMAGRFDHVTGGTVTIGASAGGKRRGAGVFPKVLWLNDLDGGGGVSVGPCERGNSS